MSSGRGNADSSGGRNRRSVASRGTGGGRRGEGRCEGDGGNRRDGGDLLGDEGPTCSFEKGGDLNVEGRRREIGSSGGDREICRGRARRL